MAKGETVGRTEPEGGSRARREEIEAERERAGFLKKKLYKVCQRNKGDRISLIPAILMSKMSLISSGF